MTKEWLSKVITLVGGLMATLAALTSVQAQTLQLPTPPIRTYLDDHKIDLLTRTFAYSETDLSIGTSDNGGLANTRFWVADPAGGKSAFVHGYLMTLNSSGGVTTVSLGGRKMTFTRSGGVYTPDLHNGWTLRKIGTTSPNWTLVAPDGTIYGLIDKGTGSYYSSAQALMSTITKPTGEILTFTYERGSYKYYTCTVIPGCTTYITFDMIRLKSVSTNSGYQIHYTHLSDDLSNTTAVDAHNDWMTLAKVQVINLAQNYCDPAANTCATDQGSISYSKDSTGKYLYATRPDGRVTTYTLKSSSIADLTGIHYPGSTYDDVHLVYDSSHFVTDAFYDYPGFEPFPFPPETKYSSTADGLGGGTVTATRSTIGATLNTRTITYSSLGVTEDKITGHYDHGFNLDTYGRVSKYYYSGSGYVSYTYDGRGNVTSTAVVTTSPAKTITVSATYDTTCTNPVTCNKPNTTTDALGNVTSYTYDPVHGGVTSMTSPAATSGGVQPQARTSYTLLYAYYKDATGSIVAAPSGIYKPTSTSTCITTASCAGSADEVKTTIVYGTTGVANNLLPTSVTTAAGDGSVTSTVADAYDVIGNKVAEDGPLSGSDDTTTWTYNADRQVTQAIGPDPDGAGALHNRSVNTSYNLNGQVTSVSTGTSNPDGSGFVELGRTDTTYDMFNRKVTVAYTAGGAIQSRSDYSYDTNDRLICTSVRMNPAVFATPLTITGYGTPACTLGPEGSYGPDRITKNVYDIDDRITQVQTAYGTALQRNEITRTYNTIEQLVSVADAKGNLTSFAYDKAYRLTQTNYPSPATAGTSSTTDFETLTYDDAGHVLSRRLRDGKQITYTYDNLGRQTLAHMVNPVDANDRDIATSYDLLGRVTSVDDGNGKKVSFAYDALGRKLSESPQLTGGSTTYQYDAAGRRTRLTWSDGFYVTYDYDTLGELTAIRENGAASGVGVLASFSYDDQGKPTSLTRGNGINSSYVYDAASRLQTYTINHPTAGNIYSFAYNPAGQLISRGMSNDAYGYSQAAIVNRNYTTNGLNQYTASGSVAPTYDGRGNMTSAGSDTYVYDSKNQLTTFGTNSLSYDAEGRLASEAVPGTTRFVYDGSDLIAETDASNNILRRYVHIPGTDNVLVWYEGSGTTDRRWLARDERGSTTLVTDASGNSLGINAYDEYGIPASTNVGRFQFTGQTWLPELGMYYYKARIYSASMGRFMQTDPTGYDDGPNWYNYVHGDPVNGLDPLGTADIVITGPRICVGCELADWIINATMYDKLLSWYSVAVRAAFEYHYPGPPNDSGKSSGTKPTATPKPQKQQPKPCPGPLRRPSASMMNEATNKGLASVPGGGSSTPLTSEFSKIDALPDFSSGGWRREVSTHSPVAYEHDLAGTDKAVKVYIGDRDFGGANTVTITDPTASVGHYAAWLPFEMGMPVNARNAAVYLSEGGC